MAAVYNQEAGNATLYVDGVSVTAQTSIPKGGVFSRDAGENDIASGVSAFSTSLRIGAGPRAAGAADGSTGFIGFVDEVFVYGTALSVDELDYLYRAAQVSRLLGVKASKCPRQGPSRFWGPSTVRFAHVERLASDPTAASP